MDNLNLNVLNYKYDINDIFITLPNDVSNSKLDNEIQRLWDRAQKEGLFRYTLKQLQTKKISGKYDFIIQLNQERAYERRSPQLFVKMHQKFDDDQFNFTKIKSAEILFEFLLGEKEHSHNTVIINTSPLEYGNILLVPDLSNLRPQILTLDAIDISLKFMLSSSNKYMRMAYNSQLACASVNHQHIHAYYVQHHLVTEKMNLHPLHIYDFMNSSSSTRSLNNDDVNDHLNLLQSTQTSPTTSLFEDDEHFTGVENCLCQKRAFDNSLIFFTDPLYPVKGVVFILNSTENLPKIAKYISTFIKCLEDMEIPHNVFITRGTLPDSLQQKQQQPRGNEKERSISANSSQLGTSNEYECIRIYVWPRKPNFEAKNSTTMNVAACEISGHILIKDPKEFERVTYHDIRRQLSKFSYKIAHLSKLVQQCGFLAS